MEVECPFQLSRIFIHLISIIHTIRRKQSMLIVRRMRFVFFFFFVGERIPVHYAIVNVCATRIVNEK